AEETPRRTRAPRRRSAAAAPEAVTPEETPTDLVTPEEMPAAPEAPFTPESAPPALPAVEPVSGDAAAVATEVGRLRALVEQQRTVLAELRAGMLTLGQQVDRGGYRPRLGIFVDVPNLMYGVEGGRPVHMGRLLSMLREGRQLVRATAYSPISDDPREPIEHQKFVAPFVPYDYRIVTKSLKRFADGSIKGNFDVEMAIDMVSMADRVEVIAIVSGDADFARAVEAVQNRGVRVEVVAFAGSTSLEMRALADHYLELGTVVDRIT
ncbi:MAG: NYN domain-containing protein, partial [Chloroflexi bacterium]|nr:NYN domain-containing protein [Chloroflexota bacterium]